MNLTRETLFDALRTVVMTSTGVSECILDGQSGPAPDGDYATIGSFKTVTSLSQPSVSQTDTEQTLSSNMHVECSVNFYRGDAQTTASKLNTAGFRNDVIWPLFSLGIKWQKVGPVNDLSALQSSRTEQRAQISVYLMFIETTTVALNRILKAPIKSIEYANGTEVYQGTI